jgi:hypothetical protein
MCNSLSAIADVIKTSWLNKVISAYGNLAVLPISQVIRVLHKTNDLITTMQNIK